MIESRTDSAEIKKLTKRKKTGELYARRPDVELQIGKVLTYADNEIFELLHNKNRESDNYLLDETIVYILREKESGNDDFRETLYLELNRRIWKLLNKFKKRFANPADFEDFRQKVEIAILKKLFDFNTDSADYMQINFGDYVVKTAKVVWKGELVKIERDKDLFYSHSDEDEVDNTKDIENTLRSNDALTDFTMTLKEGLAKLPPNIMLVAELLLDGWQIESKNENEPTISKKLNVSSRTIRNWLKGAKTILADYHAEVRK